MPELEDAEVPKEEPAAAPALEDTPALEDAPKEPKNEEAQKFIKEKLSKLNILSAETLKKIEEEEKRFINLPKDKQIEELKNLLKPPTTSTETPSTEEKQEGGRKKRRRKTKKKKSKKRKSKKRKTRRRKSKRRR